MMEPYPIASCCSSSAVRLERVQTWLRRHERARMEDPSGKSRSNIGFLVGSKTEKLRRRFQIISTILMVQQVERLIMEESYSDLDGL